MLSTQYTWRRGLRPAAALAAVTLAGCGTLLEVDLPDIIPPEQLEAPGAIPTIHAGSVNDFRVAYVGGGTEGLLLVGGSFADELGNSETFPTRKEYDQRNVTDRNGTLNTVFRNLHRARRSAENAAEQIARVSTNPAADSRISENYSFAGFTYVMAGENYCSGVPVSSVDFGNGSIGYGDPLTTTQLFQRAIERFDQALQNPVTAAARNLARVGKARALLNLGQHAEAAAVVGEVPTTFAYNATHSLTPGALQNTVFVLLNQSERWTVANRDGGNGLPFREANDPRVPWARTPANDLGFDTATPQFDQGKYPNESAAVPIANGVEARLIEAEAKLKAGAVQDWLTLLNTLRATTSLLVQPANYPPGFPAGFPDLQPLTDPGTESARVDLMFRERAFWLYLTGHRLGDLRRLVRQYGRVADDIYPGGGGKPYVINGNNKGGNFGNDYNLLIPFDETNNPQFISCIDRNP